MKRFRLMRAVSAKGASLPLGDLLFAPAVSTDGGKTHPKGAEFLGSFVSGPRDSIRGDEDRSDGLISGIRGVVAALAGFPFSTLHAVLQDSLSDRFVVS